MKHFTIDSENNITIHASRNAAKESAAGRAFSSEVQFADLIGNDSKRLIEIWNSLPGVTPVKKFTNRKIATERIWKAIQNLGEAATPVEAEQQATPFDEPVATVGAQGADVATTEAPVTKKATQAKKALSGEPKAKVAREGSKTDQAIALMKRPGGATLPELSAAFGWQAHTVRGFVAGTLKKMGLTVASSKPQGGCRTYSISA